MSVVTKIGESEFSLKVDSEAVVKLLSHSWDTKDGEVSLLLEFERSDIEEVTVWTHPQDSTDKLIIVTFPVPGHNCIFIKSLKPLCYEARSMTDGVVRIVFSEFLD